MKSENSFCCEVLPEIPTLSEVTGNSFLRWALPTLFFLYFCGADFCTAKEIRSDVSLWQVSDVEVQGVWVFGVGADGDAPGGSGKESVAQGDRKSVV